MTSDNNLPATIYAHYDTHTEHWVSNYEMNQTIWRCNPNYYQGYPSTSFIHTISGLPDSSRYFSFKEYNKESVKQTPGYYLIHYGSSRTMWDQNGLALLDPEIRDSVNRGELTLLIVFVWETFDSTFSAKFWMETFCLRLTEIGITRDHSVKILNGSFDRSILLHRDSRISWIFYPYLELVCQQKYKTTYESPPQRDFSLLREKKFLNLNRSPRRHRVIINSYIEFKNYNQYGYVTWPDDHSGNYYNELFNARNFHAEIKNFPDFEAFVITHKKFKGNYHNCYEKLYLGEGKWQFIDALNFYNLADLEIINETHQSNVADSIFLTEKTFRSVFAGIPFMLFSNTNSLKLLHWLGYKTFPMLFDESYDTKRTQLAMIASIVDQLKKFCIDSPNENFFNTPEVIETVQHNQNLFWSKNHAAELYKLLKSNISFNYS